MHLKSKYKYMLILIILAFFLISFILRYFISRSYTLYYSIDNFKVKEQFNKKKSSYFFQINGKNTYKYYVSHNYSKRHKLVNNIQEKDNCISFNAFNNNYSECIKDGEYFTSFYNKKIKNSKISSYKNIDIYDLNNSIYYIWNYTDFIVLSDESNTNLKIFNGDQYELNYIGQMNNYLLIADYDEEHYFDNFILLDMINNSYEKIKINQKLYFDGYILGYYKKYFYIYDVHNQKEYKFNPFINDLNRTKNTIYENGKWNTISNHKLDKKEYYFSDAGNYYFYLDNGYLFYHDDLVNIKVLSKKINKLVSSDDLSANFIIDNVLYNCHINKGCKKLLKYSEWKFNNENIYIINN